MPLQKLQTARRTGECRFAQSVLHTTSNRLQQIPCSHHPRVQRNNHSTDVRVVSDYLKFHWFYLWSFSVLFANMTPSCCGDLVQELFWFFFSTHLSCQSLARSVWSFQFGIGSLVSCRTLDKIQKCFLRTANILVMKTLVYRCLGDTVFASLPTIFCRSIW